MIVIFHRGFTLKPVVKKTPVRLIGGQPNPEWELRISPKPYVKESTNGKSK